MCFYVLGIVGTAIKRGRKNTTFAATKDAGSALETAFSGGSIVGMVVVGLGLVGLAVSYLFLSVETLTAFGMGASSIALFARVGGGIYSWSPAACKSARCRPQRP